MLVSLFNKLIGLQFSKYNVSLLGFGISVIAPCFSDAGSSPKSTDSLKTASKKGARISLKVL